MITTIIISIAVIFVMLGALISAFAAIGLIRLKDVYHVPMLPVKQQHLGRCFYFGAFLYFIGTEGYVNMQLIIGIIFVFITGPLSSHMIMKAAYNIQTPYSKDTKVDEIKEDMKDTKL